MKLTKIKSYLIALKLEILFFIIFVLYRLPQLGFDNINIDAPVWKTRTFEFASAFFSLNFDKTDVTYHPGVTLMWLSAVGVKIYNLFASAYYGNLDLSTIRDYVGLDFTQKLMLVIVYALTLSITLHYLKKLNGNLFTFLFFFLLTFEPYFIGLTRVLHTDGMVTLFLFASYITLYYSLTKNSRKSFVLSAFFAALSILTKSNSLIFIAYIFIFLILFNLKGTKNLFIVIKKSLKLYVLWGIIILAFFTLIWPAMWVIPIQTIQKYIYGITGVGLEEHSQEWFGVWVKDPGYLFYLVVYFIRSTPYFLILSTSGILLFVYSIFKYKKVDKLYLGSLLFVIFYTFILSISDKKLGRYILPVFPFMGLFAIYYFTQILNYFKLKTKNRKLLAFLFSFIFIILSFIQTYKIFPDYLMYFSPIIGGYEVGKNIEELKWPIGYSTLATYLNGLEGSKDRYVLIRYGYIYNPWNISKKTGTLSQKTDKDPGVYFILEKLSDWRYVRGKGVKLIKILKVGGYDTFWIYEILGDYDVTKDYKFMYPKGSKLDPKF